MTIPSGRSLLHPPAAVASVGGQRRRRLRMTISHTDPLRAFPVGILLDLRRGGDAAALPASRISCGHSSCLFR